MDNKRIFSVVHASEFFSINYNMAVLLVVYAIVNRLHVKARTKLIAWYSTVAFSYMFARFCHMLCHRKVLHRLAFCKKKINLFLNFDSIWAQISKLLRNIMLRFVLALYSAASYRVMCFGAENGDTMMDMIFRVTEKTTRNSTWLFVFVCVCMCARSEMKRYHKRRLILLCTVRSCVLNSPIFFSTSEDGKQYNEHNNIVNSV